ncbi:phage minor head protein [Prosthecobacter sp.]|jgi:SPP1 gp7 family putative phage head morphogenesis protein|uniref:phage head morphogenesis protein n=1 Tax=Prosthecobacter sp. TaxID=1965333 RepID=UPI0037CA1851
MPPPRKPLPKGFLTEPVPNERAMEWIKGKTPVSAAVFNGLLPELKARAIAVSGATSASLARDIRDAVAAVPAGADWDKQRAKIADLVSPFTGAEGDVAARKAATRKAELMLRTHGFQGYAVAQHEVMREQADIFPYWQYLSTEDERVRQSHSKLNKLIFPAASPFWHRHTPPWDWGCRCRKVALLPEEVAEIQAREAKLNPEKKTVIEGPALDLVENQNKLNRGPTEVYDITAPADRGKPGAFLFEPDSLRLGTAELQGRYDPQTWTYFQDWANRTPVVEAVEDGPAVSVWEWMGGAKLPDVPVLPPIAPPVVLPPVIPVVPVLPVLPVGVMAPPVAVVPPVAAPVPGARTLASVTADLDADIGEWSGLVSERSALALRYELARARGDTAEVVRLASEHAAKDREMDRLIERLRGKVEIPAGERGKVTFTNLTPTTQGVAKAGAAIAERYTHAGLLPTVGVKALRGKRAFHRAGTIYVNAKTKVSTVAHEVTHATEQQAASVLSRALAFLKLRAGNEPLKTLRSLTGIKQYGPGEFAWEDEWVKRGGDHYMGKTYGPRATELLTMGIERLHEDPMEFYVNDRTYFEFVISALQNL